jgi:hypothetical protein
VNFFFSQRLEKKNIKLEDEGKKAYLAAEKDIRAKQEIEREKSNLAR